MRNRDGFTLLELVAALSLSAVIGIWAAGFFGSQMHEYKKQTQILKTEELADRVCFQITSRLDHAFLFRVDPKESSVLYYCEGSGELGEQWEQISEEDLGLGAEKEYEVRLDFSDTQSQKAVSEITVLYKGEKVYSRTIRLSSVYGYLEDGEDEEAEENENEDIPETEGAGADGITKLDADEIQDTNERQDADERQDTDLDLEDREYITEGTGSYTDEKGEPCEVRIRLKLEPVEEKAYVDTWTKISGFSMHLEGEVPLQDTP